MSFRDIWQAQKHGLQSLASVGVIGMHMVSGPIVGVAIGWGLDKWLGTELDDEACTYLKDFGAATASNGAVGLYHIDKLTPEAVKYGEELINKDAKVYVVDDEELERVYREYPVIWKNKDAEPKLCFMGCPHMSLQQLKDWTEKVEADRKSVV